MSDRRAVLVLGMARSGTSAITRLLALLGVELGPEEGLLRSGAEENPKGFFEHRAIVRLNEELLHRMGGSWREPPRLTPGWQQAAPLEDLRMRARELIAGDFADAPLWGFKDPRTSLTLPFWEDLIGGGASYVVCHRRPLDSALSLDRRNAIRLDEGVALWLRYTAAALANTTGRRRILVGYDELFSNRSGVLGELADFLQLPGQAAQPVPPAAVEEWIEADLRHHAATLGELAEHPAVSADALALDLLFERAIELRGAAADAAPVVGALDGMARRLLFRENVRAALPAALETPAGSASHPGPDAPGAGARELLPRVTGTGLPSVSRPEQHSDGAGARELLPRVTGTGLPSVSSPEQRADGAGVRSVSSPPATADLLVSVIVCLADDPWGAMACLESLGQLDPGPPEYELVLVDNAALGLRRILAKLPESVRLVRLPARVGALQALRAGVGAATAEVVVCLPAPACPAPGALAAMCAALEGRAAVVSVDGNDALTTPAAARALALRREQLPALDAPDELAIGALCLELAGAGEVYVCADAHVPPPPPPLCRRGPGPEPIEVSIVIPTLDAASPAVRECLRAVQATVAVAHEIVIVENGAPPQGFSAPVNAALRAARGRSLVVMNDDVRVLEGWWEPLAAALQEGAPLVFPLTVGGYMHWRFAAWCFAMRRELLERMAWREGELFDLDLVIWGQDQDLAKRMAALGIPPVCVPESRIRHLESRTVRVARPHVALRDWIQGQLVRDTERFRQLHPGEMRRSASTEGRAPLAPTAEYRSRASVEAEVALSGGPTWRGQAFDWRVDCGHFFLVGEIEVQAGGPVEDILVQAVFGTGERELFWMNVVPGVMGTGRRSFAIPRERARAIAQPPDSPSPEWSAVSTLTLRARSRLRGALTPRAPFAGDTVAVVRGLRLLALLDGGAAEPGEDASSAADAPGSHRGAHVGPRAE
jgi:hypothetical protein